MNAHGRSMPQAAGASRAEVGALRRPDAAALKQGFALFPSGVVVATTVDADGTAHGFTASTFVPLSVDPPMVLVCLNRSALCYHAFLSSSSFAVSVLRPEHRDIALRFATRGTDKFAGLPFVAAAGGSPVLEGALAAFECSMTGRHQGGDHVILTGRVERMRCEAEGPAMVHFARSFRSLAI
jgi:flavin reductase ActVB